MQAHAHTLLAMKRVKLAAEPMVTRVADTTKMRADVRRVRGRDMAGVRPRCRTRVPAGVYTVMQPTDEQTISRLLDELPSRPEAAGELLPLVYEQLRAIAGQRMREERAGHTLQATALVHEAYMRLSRGSQEGWEGRGHFFRVAADSMRKILIDHARKKKAEKRGGGKKPVTLSGAEIGIDGDPDATLALHEALESLAKEDARAAEVVHLRFFAGLGFPEIAEVMKVSERTIMREWAFARARLVQLIDPESVAEIE